jgi:hypothetical protein
LKVPTFEVLEGEVRREGLPFFVLKGFLESKKGGVLV